MKLLAALLLSLILFTWIAEPASASSRSIQKKVLQILNSKARQITASPSRLWNYAHWSSEHSRYEWSNRLFIMVLNHKNSTYDKHEIYLNIARNYFQMKMFKSALMYYNKVPKTSELWLMAVEERAWSKVRLGQYDQALADTATLLSPVFSHISSPETHYLYGYINLAVCNYKNVFKNTELFKKRHVARISALEKFQSRQARGWVQGLTQKIAEKGVQEGLDRDSLALFPRFFYKYKKIRDLLRKVESSKKASLAEILQMETLLAAYARYDLNEYRIVIKKLQLIEADVIQRIHIDETLLGQRRWNSQEKQVDPYALKFPFDEEDVWVDELDNYDVRAKSCPKIMEAKL
ncbi:MAG: hypothetical protein KDD61_13415 [Bdellovibrionales bacterium]|nr:hypothetical protein [Bdellovibrionales bacterium]